MQQLTLGQAIKQAVRFAETRPWPEPAEAMEDVFV
jgi:TPP-dependent pyruvate/acetoin dehydrogenase alpha subunit